MFVAEIEKLYLEISIDLNWVFAYNTREMLLNSMDKKILEKKNVKIFM